MSRANPLWGAPRIDGELLKLGIKLIQATVSKYMVRRRKPPSQSWRAFLKNHAKDIVSVAFFTVLTATFRVLFVFLVLSNNRRRVIHFNVTESPTAARTGRQIVEAFPWDTAPGYLLCDRDGKFRKEFIHRFNEKHLRRVLKQYSCCSHECRTHLGLEKDCPQSRLVEPPELGPISKEPMVGGLHHRCFRRAA